LLPSVLAFAGMRTPYRHTTGFMYVCIGAVSAVPVARVLVQVGDAVGMPDPAPVT